MEAIRKRSLSCLSGSGFHKLSYLESGPEHPVPVVCLHGLARNARDFDNLAGALTAAGRRVICADVAGRGESGWLRRPMDYGYPQYLADTAALIARLDCEQVDIVGTSMGGLIGMMLAAQPDNPVRRLVINDVCPVYKQRPLQSARHQMATGRARLSPQPQSPQRHLNPLLKPPRRLRPAQLRTGPTSVYSIRFFVSFIPPSSDCARARESTREHVS